MSGCCRSLLLAALTLCVLLPAFAADQARFIDAKGNVRAGPGTTEAILRVPPQGTVVTVLEKRDTWWNVRFADGTQGWCGYGNRLSSLFTFQ